jgi:RNA polymerase sigma factor (sigma-70 family)
MRELISLLSPVVQWEVANLLRSRAGAGRDPRQELEDLVQEVFSAIFAHDARALRAWRPDGGRSLISFVRLLARHQTASILRNAKKNPWTDEPTEAEVLDRARGSVDDLELAIASRESLARLLEHLRGELTPRGMQLFQILYVEEKDVEAACRETGMTREAVYMWRSRLKKLVAELARGIEAEDGSRAAGSAAQGGRS